MGIIGNAIQILQKLECLTYSSPYEFTLEVVNHAKTWDGIVEYSLNGQNWSEWNGVSVLTSGRVGGVYAIFLRGIGNTYITGSNQSSSYGPWHAIGSNIKIAGNMLNLLDYTTVPTVAPYAFAALFNWPSSDPKGYVTDISGIIIPDPLSAYCYNGTFSRNSAITLPPQFMATGEVPDRCYYFMFRNCASLNALPRIKSFAFNELSLGNMYDTCSSIKISDTQTGEYQTPYRIPIEGTGVDKSTDQNALGSIFANTGGTYTSGTPSVNTTFYTSNLVVG